MHTHRLTKTATDNSPKRIPAPRQASRQKKPAGEEITRATTELRTLQKNRFAPIPEIIPKHLFHEAYHSVRIIVNALGKKKKSAE